MVIGERKGLWLLLGYIGGCHPVAVLIARIRLTKKGNYIHDFLN